MWPTGGQHAEVEANIAHELRSFIKGRGIGKVMCGEVGIVIQRNPDTVRGADVAFISRERSQNASPVGYLDVAPELIVEVISPNDLWIEISEKLEEYFSVGALTVWIVNPKRQQVLFYRSPTEAQLHGPDDVLSGGAVLPGFEVKVEVLFSE